ncbi:MAG: ankyrin repeat domain-containing protein [Spirochaetaceae bacterium]|jgi:ankyrin repeat protein|nr:ankyrin repeat domain-containing protein [Spirochaetaceae bacterium]
MKILLLYGKEGEKTASLLDQCLKKNKVKAEARLLGKDWYTEVPLLSKRLEAATHIVVVFSPAAAGSSWFAFTAGFALGKALPLLGFGGNAPAPEPVFSKQLIPIPDEGRFIAYISKEKKLWPLEDACKKAKAALLDQGIPLTVEALGNCISQGKTAEVELFLQAGFIPDTRDKAGVPLLCLAARAGDRRIVNILLKAGAPVNSRALDRGSTALIDSASGKHKGIMADLLAAGADVNMKSKDGQSALIIAVGLNDAPCTEILLKAGAEADEPDSLGASARKYAALFKQPEILELFNVYAR